MTQDKINQMFEGRWRMKRYILENIDGKAAKEIARDFFEAGIELGQEPAKPTLSDISARAQRFFDTFFTAENIVKYGERMLQDFFDYWSEPNPSNTKMRFEMQKTWDIDRRLARWARNNFNRYDRQQTPSENLDKLTDILVG